MNKNRKTPKQILARKNHQKSVARPILTRPNDFWPVLISAAPV